MPRAHGRSRLRCGVPSASDRRNDACSACEKAPTCPDTGKEGPCPDFTPAGDRTAGRDLAGLCATCDMRFDCPYPRPEGGVWRCAHFR